MTLKYQSVAYFSLTYKTIFNKIKIYLNNKYINMSLNNLNIVFAFA